MNISDASALSVALNSRSLARKYAREEIFGRAFSHYLVALKLKPEWKSSLEYEFSAVLCQWGMALEKKNKLIELFTCYEQAVAVFPQNILILNNLGAHLLS